MDTNNGTIRHLLDDEKDMEAKSLFLEKALVEIESDDELKSLKRMSKPRRINKMRNKPCVCGSGKKFKKCCWNETH